MVTINDFKIRVELCDDGETWVWTLLVDGNVWGDGYESTEQEALQKAKIVRRDEVDRLNSEVESSAASEALAVRGPVRRRKTPKFGRYAR